MEWISVKDKLPTHRQKVLCCTKDSTMQAIFMEKLINEVADYQNVFRTFDGGYYKLCLNLITHWMPLPEPPKN